ncbi:MAG: hypothetical protein M3011_13905 [Actinomycetota bacterium]|nr:hypothetical protein [Actinomycetota bacterium]
MSLDFDDVERWAAEARVGDAVDARQRQRWLSQQAQEEAAFAGLLLGLAERGVVVIVTTTGARHHIGRVTAVGADFVALGTTGGRTTLLSLAAIASVKVADAAERHRRDDHRRSGPPGDARGDRGTRIVGVTMADVMGHSVERRPRVQLFAGVAQLGGELRAVGTDVATLHTDGDPPGLAYVRLASVSELSFLDSG